jgi:hypothetical protein
LPANADAIWAKHRRSGGSGGGGGDGKAESELVLLVGEVT